MKFKKRIVGALIASILLISGAIFEVDLSTVKEPLTSITCALVGCE